MYQVGDLVTFRERHTGLTLDSELGIILSITKNIKAIRVHWQDGSQGLYYSYNLQKAIICT
jgi:hypothetical protein